MKRLGTYNGYNYYYNATWYAVRRFQASHHLKVTGNVDQKTWTKLGLGKKLFKQIDSYTAPLGAQAWKGRKAHIEAMIRLAYKYMGHPYLVGSSSMIRYGTDCSGLVIQSLYAGAPAGSARFRSAPSAMPTQATNGTPAIFGLIRS